MATIVEPGQRSATLEPRTVKRAIAEYLRMAHGVIVAWEAKESDVDFTGITLAADGSAHVTLHDKSNAFQRAAFTDTKGLDS